MGFNPSAFDQDAFDPDAFAFGEGSESDTTPDAFSFTDQSGVALETVTTSTAITVTGITAAATITVTGGNYIINGGTPTSEAGTVSNGDTVQAQGTSSDAYLSAVDVVVTIGGVSDTFRIRTLADPAAKRARVKMRFGFGF